MRTLVNIKDIMAEYARPEECPRCGPESSLPLVQASIDFSPKGKIQVIKIGMCEIHGSLTIRRHVKAVQMHGKDAQIIPPHE